MNSLINPRLLQDLSERLGAQDLFQWIEAEAERLGKLGRGRNNVVYFSSQLIRARNVAQVVPKATVGNANIVPKNGYYLIYVNKFLPLLPRRFAIAHEIGHTYWFAPGGEGRPLSPLQWTLGRDPNIEILCNRFAAALLLPRSLLVNALSSTDFDLLGGVPCLSQIPKIAQAHWVAEQLVARRLFFEILSKRIAIVCLRCGGLAKECNDLYARDWQISWAALPSELGSVAKLEGGVIVAKATGRRVPPEMLPSDRYNKDGIAKLDSRWWDIIRVASPDQARIPLKRWASGAAKVGYYSVVGDRVYLGLPLLPEGEPAVCGESRCLRPTPEEG